MIEVWKPVVGFEKCYEISDRGNLRSLDRITIRKDGARIPLKGKTMTPALTGRKRCQYLGTVLRTKDKKRTVRIHRLVAEAFLVRDSIAKDQVNHIDGNKLNNKATNLEWCTHKHNIKHAFATGLHKGMVGSRNPFACINEATAYQIKVCIKSGMRQIDIMKKFNVSKTVVYKIKTGQSWTHV